jgi:sarcosine/dimethylglycine N-methyltransferase
MTTASAAYSEVVETARGYYNSTDAEAFYSTIWGGEDIHIGLYDDEAGSIAIASRRSVERLMRHLEPLDQSSRVLDMGSGYGGTSRYLASTYGCRVVGLNLSEVENERARRLNTEQGLADRIDIVDGSFEAVDADSGSFDAVSSQDAFLHSGERRLVVSEAARVLKPGGRFAFTDIMQADDCPDGVLDPILNRIHLSSLGTPSFYSETAAACDLDEIGFIDLTPQLVNHYSRVLAATEARGAELRGKISDDYLQRMKQGLVHWVDGGEKGYLVWGMMTFRKRPVLA